MFRLQYKTQPSNEEVYNPTYRYLGANFQLPKNSNAHQYQTLKIITNQVRVQSSQYTNNLAALSSYKNATILTNNVCWNQMSDRPLPSNSNSTIPSSQSILSNKHHSNTSSRPGSQTPGGKGVDIKHNSYQRRINRLIAKSALKQSGIPQQIPYTRAYPIYGGKTMKPGMITNCNCNSYNQQPLYTITNPASNLLTAITTININLSVGDLVYAKYLLNSWYSRATIISINEDSTYTVQYDDNVIENKTILELKVYSTCACYNVDSTSSTIITPEIGIITDFNNEFNTNCLYPNLQQYLQ